MCAVCAICAACDVCVFVLFVLSEDRHLLEINLQDLAHLSREEQYYWMISIQAAR